MEDLKYYEAMERIISEKIKIALENQPGRKIMSDSINELTAALSLARKGFLPLYFNRLNQMLLTEYVDYYAIYDATKDALGDNGLAVFHAPQDNGSHTILVTYLSHSSGQYTSCETILNSMVNDSRVWVSQLNETKKQHILSLLGFSAENNEQDDDLEAEAHNDPDNKLALTPSYITINKTELDELDYELAGDEMKPVYEQILRTYRIKRLSELPKSKYKQVKANILKIKGFQAEKR